MDIRCHIAAGAVPGKIDPWMEDVRKAEGLHQNITIGKKTYKELRELYARSRFVVVPLFPTDTDNGTTTILEAMAMGKAVICTRVTGQADVIQEGITGIFVPPQDPVALGEAIRYLWQNPDIAERMGTEGRRVIEQDHTLERWLARIKSIVEEAIEAHRANGRRADDHMK
jgi:glycosyltransferase involved in cell wall biosynthesis